VPAVLVQLPGLPVEPDAEGRRQVTITSKAGTDTFPITNPEADHGGLGPEFTQVPRPGARPIHHVVGRKLRTMRLEVTLVPTPPRSTVDDLILVLGSHAALGPCTVAYGRLEAGLWDLAEIEVHTEHRQPVTNDVTQATATLAFVEASPVPGPSLIRTASGSSSTAPAAAAVPAVVPATPAPTPRRHTMRAGDTLIGLAIRYYGDASKWRSIAQANGIRDTRRIPVGAVLVIP
jgi:LysM repeat protein